MATGFVILAFIVTIAPSPWIIPTGPFPTLAARQDVASQMSGLLTKGTNNYFWCIPASPRGQS